MAILHLFRDTLKAYFSDRSITYAAGLAYYAVFAIAPLLVFTVAVAGFFIGHSSAAAVVAARVEYLVGPQVAALLAELVQELSRRTFSTGATVFSVIGLTLSAAGIFNQLDKALNDIWGIQTRRPQGFSQRLLLVRRRLMPFLTIFFLGVLLGFSVLVDTTSSALSARLSDILPQVAALLPQLSTLLIPLLAFATFAVIFKWLPDAQARWRDVAVGALLTVVLFSIGRLLLTTFLARSDQVSLYGAAGSFVLLLMWVYYSAQILLFGAEFTKLYADRFGQPITPRRLAYFEDEEAALRS